MHLFGILFFEFLNIGFLRNNKNYLNIITALIIIRVLFTKSILINLR